jgi:hypothetical protein
MARRPKVPKGAHPQQLRARAFKYLLRAKLAQQNAEKLYRAADRAEARVADESVDPAWPWPCKDCGFAYPKEEMERHVTYNIGLAAEPSRCAHCEQPVAKHSKRERCYCAITLMTGSRLSAGLPIHGKGGGDETAD